MISPDAEQISVCICTYRRPGGIERCLRSLARAIPSAGQVREIIVVDNDVSAGAADVVNALRAEFATPIRYFVEPSSGVSFARNRCIAEAGGRLIAFVDDDEFVCPGWLHALKAALDESKADVALGPVIPSFETEVPRWLAASGVFDRPRFRTGEVVHWGNGRTGNVLFRREMALACGGFDNRFAESGGEDLRLFLEFSRRFDARFVWCEEAIVFETVPPTRAQVSYILSRALLSGRSMVRVLAEASGLRAYAKWGVRGLLTLPVNLLMAAISLPFSRGTAMRHARRAAGDVGKVSALLPYRDRRYGSSA